MNKIEALEKSVEIWEQLAEVGYFSKQELSQVLYDDPLRLNKMYMSACPLCEYSSAKAGMSSCMDCPCKKELHYCVGSKSPYNHWIFSETVERKKENAFEILHILKNQLKKEMEKVGKPKRTLTGFFVGLNKGKSLLGL